MSDTFGITLNIGTFFDTIELTKYSFLFFTLRYAFLQILNFDYFCDGVALTTISLALSSMPASPAVSLPIMPATHISINSIANRFA